MDVSVALTYGVRGGGDEDADSLEVAFDSALSHKMPHVEMVKAAHTEQDDIPEEPPGKHTPDSFTYYVTYYSFRHY